MPNDIGWVLDASALLAVMRGERGADVIDDRLGSACISAVNLSEVVAKLAERGVSPGTIDQIIAELNLNVIAFDESQAMLAGQLRSTTRLSGLSFGDRACLALARDLDAIALTTDRAWADLDIGVQVELAR